MDVLKRTTEIIHSYYFARFSSSQAREILSVNPNFFAKRSSLPAFLACVQNGFRIHWRICVWSNQNFPWMTFEECVNKSISYILFTFWHSEQSKNVSHGVMIRVFLHLGTTYGPPISPYRCLIDPSRSSIQSCVEKMETLPCPVLLCSIGKCPQCTLPKYTVLHQETCYIIAIDLDAHCVSSMVIQLLCSFSVSQGRHYMSYGHKKWCVQGGTHICSSAMRWADLPFAKTCF